MTGMDRDRRAVLRALAGQVGLSGPWRWSGRVKRTETEPTHVQLVAPDPRYGGVTPVMGFKRVGMQDAQPTFSTVSRGAMVPADQVPMYEWVDRDDICGLDHPVAAWIAACDPDTVVALLDRIDELEAAVAAQAAAPAPRRRWWQR